MIRHIVFRCVQCRGTTSVQAEWTRRDIPAEVICRDCNAVYQLPAQQDRGVSNRDYYEKVRRFATENNLDLPSAFSVLEGILPRDKVRTLSKGSPELVEPRSSAALRRLAIAGAVVVALAFVGAYYRDVITPQLAFERAGKGPDTVRVGAIRSVQRAPETPHASADVSFVPIVLQTNESGAITKVAGPDPKNVLLAYCRQPGVSERLSPVTVSPTYPPNAGLRLGVLRSLDESGALFSVPIWLDGACSRWTIGNGSRAIQPEPLALGEADAPAANPEPEADGAHQPPGAAE